MAKKLSPGSIEALRQTVTDQYIPVYVLAGFAQVPNKKAVNVFLAHRDQWQLDIRQVCMDGHNPVYCVRKRQRLLIDDVMRSWKVYKG